MAPQSATLREETVRNIEGAAGDRLEDGPHLQPSQVHTEAEVLADAEREVVVRLARDVDSQLQAARAACNLPVLRKTPTGQPSTAEDVLSSTARDAGIAGTEFLRSIPGTVGGFVRMNGGAYGRETCERPVGRLRDHFPTIAMSS